MDILSKIEHENNITLPKLYKDFYRLYSLKMPENLVGSDLVNKNRELKDWALELMKADGVANFLTKDDFVFMMHQGYIFWYFKADGDADPIVYGYHEGRLKPDKLVCFSEFIKDFIR